MTKAFKILPVISLLLTVSLPTHAEDTPADLLARAQESLKRGKSEEALDLAGKALAADPRFVHAYLFKGTLLGSLARHAEAVTDFTKAIELDPKAAETYNRRGAEHFKLGHIDESIKDFDRFLEFVPQQTPSHWMRGISYYYAGRYQEGSRQFAAYEKVDTNDVENAVWHYLCNARLIGVEKARARMLKIGRDRRVPMMEVYDLFRGRARPEDVLAAAQAARAEERKQARFLAHLYLGLYYESLRDAQQARQQMALAASDAPVGGYMGDVARVHLLLRRKEENRK
jgi:lipoprotein NlpI